VSRRTEASGRGSEEADDVAAAGLGEEHLRGERQAREDVNHHCEPEGEETQQAGDLGEVQHPDVVGEASADRSARGGRRREMRNRTDRLLLADAPDGAAGEPEARTGDVRGGRAIAREAGESKGLDQVPDDVAVAAHRRDRLEKRADLGALRLA
jgi:hypothetical protein